MIKIHQGRPFSFLKSIIPKQTSLKCWTICITNSQIYQEDPNCTGEKPVQDTYHASPPWRVRDTQVRTHKHHSSNLRAIEQKHYQKIMLPLAIEVSQNIITSFTRILDYGRQSCKLLSHICGSPVLMQCKLGILGIFK